MPSMKAIKRRIVSVKNTQQIMKAMNLVAASKMQKNKTRLERARPLIEGARDFMERTPLMDGAEDNIYFESRTENRAVFIVITGDRGLCGGYNSNILKAALTQMEEKDERIIAIGSKCKEFFVRRNKNILVEHKGVMDNVSYRFAASVANAVNRMYLSDKPEERIDELYVAFTRFESILTHDPCVRKILPLENGKGGGNREEIIFEPDLQVFLRKSISVYLTQYLYGAMVESAACEQAARMTSMDAAARNAGEIVEDLTLMYNRKRQGAITQEISEIVGGANAI